MLQNLRTKEDTIAIIPPDPKELERLAKQKAEDKRVRRLKAYAIIAEAFLKRGDELGCRQASDDWHDEATALEIKAAPEFLKWTGRKFRRVR